jgi:uncharacterized protein (DUF885 family)
VPETITNLIDAFLLDLWEDSPILASSLGIDGYDERVGDYSEEGRLRSEQMQTEWLARFEGVPDDGLTLDERIDRDLVVSQLRGAEVMRDWAAWRRTPDLYLSPGLGGVFTLFLHRLRPESEIVAAAAERLMQVPVVLEHGKLNLDPSLANPMLTARALDQCRAAIGYTRHMVPAEASDPADRERLAEAGEIAAAAYEDFAEFLGKLAAGASGPYEIGEERYSALLQQKELLGYGAAEMRERGRAAYDEISAEMSTIAREMRGDDDWRGAVRELSRDHPETPEAMRDAYEEWTERARRFLIDHALVTMPEGERCLVEPSPPFQRPVLAVASYMSPPPFKPSRTGHFFVPYPPDGTPPEEITKRLETNAHFEIPAVSVHEAYPGHHWHLVTSQDNPSAIRRVIRTSYYSEGWALYAELMMREQGFFTEPAQELGQLQARIFRAARIVVDTSLHTGDMSVDEAVRFMVENGGLSEPTAVAEVKRYCSWPTQASSYLTGSLEIERIRGRYFAEKKGSLREFHDTICASGGLPIALAERAVMG